MALWKHTERELAKRLNGERVPVSGRTGEKGREAPDIDHESWSIEVKQRKKPRPGGSASIPKWQVEALDQANASRKDYHLGAIVILHQTGWRHDADIVMMSFKDFVRLQEML